MCAVCVFVSMVFVLRECVSLCVLRVLCVFISMVFVLCERVLFCVCCVNESVSQYGCCVV